MCATRRALTVRPGIEVVERGRRRAPYRLSFGGANTCGTRQFLLFDIFEEVLFTFHEELLNTKVLRRVVGTEALQPLDKLCCDTTILIGKLGNYEMTIKGK